MRGRRWGLWERCGPREVSERKSKCLRICVLIDAIEHIYRAEIQRAQFDFRNGESSAALVERVFRGAAGRAIDDNRTGRTDLGGPAGKKRWIHVWRSSSSRA